MKIAAFISVFSMLLAVPMLAIAQDSVQNEESDKSFKAELTLGTDLVYRLHGGFLFKYPWHKNIVFAAHTNVGRSYRSMGRIVDIPSDKFESINLTISQRFGAGFEFGSSRVQHTILALAGPNYYRLTESHSISGLESSDITVSTWIPDAGLMYGLQLDFRSTVFTLQFYMPVLLIPDNLMGATLSLGIGVN
jgi:hypothetical protein